MDGSSRFRRLGTCSFELPIRTPGPLGHNDAASPDNPRYISTYAPGPLGINDHASPFSTSGVHVGAKKPYGYGLLEEVPVPDGINVGLAAPSPELLTSLLGKPRDDYSEECQVVTNPWLASQIEYCSVGPFKAKGLCAALDSLKQIMWEICKEYPEVYRALGTAGMLCCRKQRGSSKISSHSWGTAIDLKLQGVLDQPWNGKVLFGLTLVAPFFNRNGWVWGAAFRKEDAMHFEVSKGMLSQWRREGKIRVAKTGEVAADSPL